MRHLFIPGCIAAGLCGLCLAVSLFHVQWISPDCSTKVVLQRASLRVWVGARGDWIAFRGPWGLDVAGWSTPAWSPSLERDARIWVPMAPAPPGTATVIAKQIRGLEVVMPWYIPLLALTGASTFLYFPWRRHRRERAGLCGACGYDLSGITGRCPECGLARLLAILRAWLRLA